MTYFILNPPSHGLNNQSKISSSKKLTCKETLRQVFLLFWGGLKAIL
jgi:hypothetical protein